MAAKKKSRKSSGKRKPAIKKRKAGKSKSVKKAAVALAKRVSTPVKKAYNKSQTATEIAGLVGISRKQVSEVLNELGHVIDRHIRNGGAGSFSIPGLFKVMTVRKKATKERKGINPFTGQPTVFKAKPARTVVKVRALKGLKDMVR